MVDGCTCERNGTSPGDIRRVHTSRWDDTERINENLTLRVLLFFFYPLLFFLFLLLITVKLLSLKYLKNGTTK